MCKKLLDGGFGASFFEFLLEVFGGFLFDAFFDRFRSAFDECFGFGET